MIRRAIAAIALLACTFAAAQTAPPPATTASGGAPLPDIHTVLARVRARYLALEALRKTYICTMTSTTDEFSSSGKKSTHTDQYQAFFVANTEVFQHTARDGKPLSPNDARKEQERVDKRVAQLKANSEKPDKDSIQLGLLALLRVATFSNPRRQILNGRPTLVFDYQGDPHAKAKDLSDEVMRDLTGTLWIDERDLAMPRLTGTLEQNFHVGGGLLVNLKKGSWVDFNDAPVNGEIWFPAQTTLHFDGRFLLLKGFNGNGRVTFSDYRKLKTSVTILPGTQLVSDPAAPQPPTAEPAPAPAPAPPP